MYAKDKFILLQHSQYQRPRGVLARVGEHRVPWGLLLSQQLCRIQEKGYILWGWITRVRHEGDHKTRGLDMRCAQSRQCLRWVQWGDWGAMRVLTTARHVGGAAVSLGRPSHFSRRMTSRQEDCGSPAFVKEETKDPVGPWSWDQKPHLKGDLFLSRYRPSKLLKM